MQLTNLKVNEPTHRLIFEFNDSKRLLFSRGKFDDWCIFYIDGNKRIAIRDEFIFRKLIMIKQLSPKFMFYEDFCNIFDKTTKKLDYCLIQEICLRSEKYNCKFDALFCLMFLYAGMVAEENKKNAILKKYVKRLGVHQVLIENTEPFYAANFSRGMSWRELASECSVRGFTPPIFKAVA